LSYLYFL